MADPFAKADALIKKHMKINSTAFRDEYAGMILQDIARGTPVDTGRATANWTANGGSPELTPKKRYDQSITAMPTRLEANKKIKAASSTEPIYVTNAVQGENEDTGAFTGIGYIIGLERGASMQSLPGMMFQKKVAQAKLVGIRARKEIFK